MNVRSAGEPRKLAILVQGGMLDKLYCAFILASTAVAADMEAATVDVTLFI